MANPEDSNGAYTPRMSAVYANSFRSLHPWVGATGFRTHGLQYRSLNHSSGPRVAEEFLVNTRYSRHDGESEISIRSYFYDPSIEMLAMASRRQEREAAKIPLPGGIKLRREVGEVMALRHSTRQYSGHAMDLPYLATVVRAAGAVTRHATVDLTSGDTATLHFRTTPSGGGLYPLDLYVVAFKVQGLPRGIYMYSPLDDSLVVRGGEDNVERLTGTFAVPEDIISISRACVAFLMVGHPWRSMRKYGSRGLRYVFIEAGAAAQNIHLATETLGFGSVDVASIYDDEAHEVLGFDGLFETLIHAVLVGHPG